MGDPGYGPRWRTHIRPYILNEDPRYDGHCEVPTAYGTRCGKPAAAVDHIIPLSAGGTNALENLRPACTECNSRRTPYIQGTSLGRLVVIVGPPCAGKSTYARANAGPHDLVIDHDAIAAAMGAESHAHSRYMTRVVQAARRAAIDAVLRYRPIDTTVWLIHGQPSPKSMERYTRAGAEWVELDPGIDVCKQRANAERPSRWHALIDAWYADRPQTAAYKIQRPSIAW